MAPERREIPDWARKERQGDMNWIAENLYIFWPAAQEAFSEQGRGALVVDTTSRPSSEGNPFAYFPQAVIEEGDDEDIKRMVSQYSPQEELVLVLLKANHRVSTYRVQPLQK